MVKHILAIDDVEEDFTKILKWAIEFKRLWKEGDEVAMNFLPLDTLLNPKNHLRVRFQIVCIRQKEFQDQVNFH